MGVLDNVEHRAEHAEVWVAEASGTVVEAVTLTIAGQPYSENVRSYSFGCSRLILRFKAAGWARTVVRRVIEIRAVIGGYQGDQHYEWDIHGSAQVLYESLGFHRVPARDWYVPSEDVLLCVFWLELQATGVPH